MYTMATNSATCSAVGWKSDDEGMKAAVAEGASTLAWSNRAIR